MVGGLSPGLPQIVSFGSEQKESVSTTSLSWQAKRDLKPFDKVYFNINIVRSLGIGPDVCKRTWK